MAAISNQVARFVAFAALFRRNDSSIGFPICLPFRCLWARRVLFYFRNDACNRTLARSLGEGPSLHAVRSIRNGGYNEFMPTPKLPWYQFSLRSLLLLTLFVVVLCSLGVCTDWVVSAVIAVGGVMGGILARKWSGLVLGVISGIAFAFIAVILCRPIIEEMPFMSEPFWQLFELVAIVGSADRRHLRGPDHKMRLASIGQLDNNHAHAQKQLPWYQFSLRSLLLLTLFVAVLCSIGVCTHWVVSVVIGMLALGGIVGKIVAV